MPRDGTAAGVKHQAGALVVAAAGPASQEAVLCQIHYRERHEASHSRNLSPNPAKQQETRMPEIFT